MHATGFEIAVVAWLFTVACIEREAAKRVCGHVHGHHRTGEPRDGISPGIARVVE